MSFFRNSVVQGGSWIAFIGCGLWTYYEPGFEPAIGLILGAVGIASNPVPFFGKKARNLTPEEKIALRDKWRPTFKDFFLQAARDKYRTDVIVHEVARVDDYPNINEKEKGISSWFRVGFMGTYDRGVLLGLRWTYVNQEEKGWKEYTSAPPDTAIKVMLLGAVPYEAIESFNPDGDDYYNKPHLYCHFDFGGEPYERVFYGQRNQLFEDSPSYFTEIAGFTKPGLLEGLKWRFWKR
ncbi:hypothetical protein [Rhizobium leguminosarum]|uniref:hypothetical protein n=1 Tax=Rhizobium leguminosarum TaxID=384 RepID=UPI001030ACAD|nr:hypothetical protein [Rhizobium leguminosarum]TBG52586.1 hypothetical protein ELG74_36435 [Rhizobium leguminosarum]